MKGKMTSIKPSKQQKVKSTSRSIDRLFYDVKGLVLKDK